MSTVKEKIAGAAVSLKTVLVNYKWYIIVAIVVIAIGGGSFVGGCFYGERKVATPANGQSQTIKPIGHGHAGDIPPKPNDCESYKKCAQSEIFTSLVLKDNIAKFHAYNSCKYKDDEYKIPSLYFPNTIQFMFGVGVGGYDGKIAPMFGGAVNYIHHFNPSFGLGGGPFYYSSIDKKLWNAGGNLAAEYSW